MDDQDAAEELVRLLNVNNLGLRPGSGHIRSAPTAFGDGTCGVCWRFPGGCAAHRKPATDTPPIPFAGRRAEKDIYFDPQAVEGEPDPPEGPDTDYGGVRVRPRKRR